MSTLSGIVQSAPQGAKGFDASTPIIPAAAEQFFARGYRFCIRSVARLTPRPGDLTFTEAQGLVGAGLALMVVQHVMSESGWTPDGALGNRYGVNAAAFAAQAGIPAGVNVWLDLEGVERGTAAADVMAYSENWYHRVADGGYVPGVYVGWRPGLLGSELYRLPFQHYWGGYCVNEEYKPACGWCLVQSPSTGGTIAGIRPHAYDDNVTHTDGAGRNVHWLVSA